MFSNLGWPEFAFLLVLALFVFGPERLPKVAADAGRMLRQLRQLAQSAKSDLEAELGPEFKDLDLASLNPRTFVQKHLFEDDPDPLGLDDPAAARRTAAVPLQSGERPPFDPEAT